MSLNLFYDEYHEWRDYGQFFLKLLFILYSTPNIIVIKKYEQKSLNNVVYINAFADT